MRITRNSLFGVRIGEEKVSEILRKVELFYSQKNNSFYHIANINPDIFTLALKSAFLRQIINKADSIVIDGIGIKIAAWLTGIKCGERITGTDLIPLLVKIAADKKFKVMFLGGQNNAAKLTGLYYKKKYPKIQFIADSGAYDIRNERGDEKLKVLNIIKKTRPRLLFVAYGPPYQEEWIYRNKQALKHIVCMGVGGAFNFTSGKVKRSPGVVTSAGFEWLWRLLVEPKRFRKFPRHIYFVWIVIQSIITSHFSRKNLYKQE